MGFTYSDGRTFPRIGDVIQLPDGTQSSVSSLHSQNVGVMLADGERIFTANTLKFICQQPRPATKGRGRNDH